MLVGARGVVHTPQFNGKQEEGVARSTPSNLRCPRNGQADEPSGSASVTKATGRLEQATGKATEVVSASPDTGQQGDLPQGRLYDPSTVGEGGEGVYLLVFLMKKSFAVRARVFAPALSLVGLVGMGVCAQTQGESVISHTLITATRMPQDPTLMPMGVSVISEQDIRASGVSNVSDAIRWLGGVATRIDTTGGRNPTLDLRGFGETAGSNLVILVDGVRQNEGDTGGASISWIPIESIQRIEIVRGAGAVEHGEGTTAGMINIVTKRGENEPNQSFYMGAGSQNTQEVRASIGTVSNQWRHQLFGAAYNSNNHRNNFKTQERNALARANWSDGDTVMSFQVAGQTQRSGLPGGINVAEFQADPKQSFKLRDKGNSETINLLLSGEMSAGSWRLGLDVSKRQVKNFGDYVTDAYTSDSDTSSLRTGLKAWRATDFSGVKGRLLLGIDSENWTQVRATAGSGYASRTNVDQSSNAVYVRQELNWTPQGITTYAGARRTLSLREATGDSVGKLDAQKTTWELGAAKRLSPNAQVYARTGTSFRLATADEYSCSYLCPANTLNLLAPQTSRDHEVGIRQQAGQTDWTLRYYRNDLRNEIGLESDYFSNVNYDPTRREGVEIEAKAPVSKQLGGALQLAHRNASFREGVHAGKKVPLVSQNSLTARLTYEMSAKQQWFFLYQWVDSQKIAGDLDNTCTQDIPSFGVANVRYSQRIEAWTLSGQVSNAFDKQYYDYRSRCDVTKRSIYPQAGRAFMLSASRSFN
jgi:iron complex outermembrane receptor protein